MPTKAGLEKMGKKIKEAREKSGLTQADVAKKVGIDTNYYATIERGEKYPSLKRLERIVAVLGLKASEIIPF